MGQNSSRKLSSILKKHYLKRKTDFPGLSYRWLGDKLSVSAANISQILNGQRNPPPGMILPLCRLLDVENMTARLLYEQALDAKGWAVVGTAPKRRSSKFKASFNDKWENMTGKEHDMISHWHNLAIVEATMLDDYDGSVEFISRRLGLSRAFCESAIMLLLEAGYTRDKDGRLKKPGSLMEFQSVKSRKNLMNFHRETLEQTIKKIDQAEAAGELLQVMASSVVTCARGDLPMIRAEITSFLRGLAERCSEGPAEEVYQLAMIFLPLTKPSP